MPRHRRSAAPTIPRGRHARSTTVQPSESSVHSLEHGAIWVTYSPELPAEEVDVLARLARNRTDMIVSRWDDKLPAPVVVSSWGRQLRLQSATDPRLVQFAKAFSGQGPEPNGPC